MPFSLRKCFQSLVRMVCGCLVLSLYTAAPALAEEITIYTEDYLPYNYMSEENRVEGIATDLVRQVMAEAGLEYDIQLSPWSRTYRGALTNPYGLIYSLARTADREGQFDWLVPLAKPDYYLYARADETRPVTRETIERGDFRVHCVNYDASCGILRKAGFRDVDIWENAAEAASPYILLKRKRIDLYLGDRNHEMLEHVDPRVAGVRPALKVESDLMYYMAASVDADPAMRDKIRQAYQSLLATGAIQNRRLSN